MWGGGGGAVGRGGGPPPPRGGPGVPAELEGIPAVDLCTAQKKKMLHPTEPFFKT